MGNKIPDQLEESFKNDKIKNYTFVIYDNGKKIYCNQNNNILTVLKNFLQFISKKYGFDLYYFIVKY